uniref:Uncharacterized protein At3g49140 n=1 Tax=Rhizophora mucronata TaxID=61149 RepID=A0A2P2LJY7_RHIMU
MILVLRNSKTKIAILKTAMMRMKMMKMKVMMRIWWLFLKRKMRMMTLMKPLETGQNWRPCVLLILCILPKSSLRSHQMIL